MKLEHQVVSLQPSQRLKELGFKQESLFYWKRGLEVGASNTDELNLHYGRFFNPIEIKYAISAYTVAELGEMLPEGFWSSKHQTRFECGKNIVEYDNYIRGNKPTCDMEYADTEADARAKMLIYLVENKLIKL